MSENQKAAKSYPLRLSVQLYEQIERASQQELSGIGVSVNTMMIMLLKEALAKRIEEGRLAASEEDILALDQA